MPKCNAKTEVCSLEYGYHQSARNWNNGKREEFKQQKVFEVPGSAKGGN